MKLFQLNFFGILMLLILATVILVLPSFVIQSIWNSIYGSRLEHDMSISLWQASLLWGAIVTILYMTGIFSFKLNFKTLDSIDLNSINDPELKAEIEKLKLQAKKTEEEARSPKKDD